MGDWVSVTVRPASPALAPFVSSLGYFEGRFGHARERTLPTAGTQLLVNLAADELWRHSDGETDAQRTPGAAWQGPGTRSGVIDPAHQRAIICVGFRTGGAYPFCPAPVSALRDQLVSLEELWGREGGTLRERLLETRTPAGRLAVLEQVLLARAVRPLQPDPAVTWAAAALERGVRVAGVADQLGWTRRRLALRFTDRIGMSPKRYARVRRFQRLLTAVTSGGGYGREVDWARLAAKSGYYDQAHMIHEFRAFSGLRPTAYRPRSPAEPNHVPV